MTKVEQYISERGKIFNITAILTMRDGGTKVLVTNHPTLKLYVEKDSNRIHTDYPNTEENEIKDQNFLAFIYEVFNNYNERQAHEVGINKRLYANIIESAYCDHCEVISTNGFRQLCIKCGKNTN